MSYITKMTHYFLKCTLFYPPSAAAFRGQEARRFVGSLENRVGTITARQTWKGVCSGHFATTAPFQLQYGHLLQTYYVSQLLWHFSMLSWNVHYMLYVLYVYRSCCWQQLNKRANKWRNRWPSLRAIERHGKGVGGCLLMEVTRAIFELLLRSAL